MGASHVLLGSILLSGRRHEEAETQLRRGLNVVVATLPEDHWRIAEARSLLGACLTSLSRFEEAEPLLLEGFRGLEDSRGQGSRAVLAARRRLDRFYEAAGRPDGTSPNPGPRPGQ